MTNSKAFIGRLIGEAIGAKIPLLLLRGLDEESSGRSDIDVLVPQGRASEACRELADAAAASGWKLLSFSDIGYLSQVVLVHGGRDSIESVKVDFFSGISWYGLSPDVFGNRIFAELQSRRSSAGAARLAGVVTYLQKRLSKGFLDPKDRRRVQSLLSDASLNEELEALGVVTAGQYPLSASGLFPMWSLRGASAGATGLVALVGWFFRAVMRHIQFKSRIGTRAGRVVGLSGIDGSGKSTQTTRILASYARAGVLAPTLVHLLPRWLPMPHQVIRRKKTCDAYTRPYSEPPPTSFASNLTRAAFYAVAFSLARFSMAIGVLRGRVYIFDRSPIDFFADLERARITRGIIPDSFLQIFLPRGLYVFLDVPPEVAIARKGELTLERAQSLRARYLELMDRKIGLVVDATRAPDVVFESVLSEVDRSIRRSLGWTDFSRVG